VIANPLFGTTTDQIAALFVLLDDEHARAFMNGLHENNVKLSPSNGDSADLVARGQFAFSLVDSDDVVNRMNQHEPVTMVYPDQGKDEMGSLIVTQRCRADRRFTASRRGQEAHRLFAVERNRKKARIF
jgi:iron(III) transport system substrate-binding protein